MNIVILGQREARKLFSKRFQQVHASFINGRGGGKGDLNPDFKNITVLKYLITGMTTFINSEAQDFIILEKMFGWYKKRIGNKS